MIQVKRLTPTAKIPKKGHDGDAGFDLFASERIVILPGTMQTVKTGIALGIPAGYYGQVLGRSGLAFKRMVFPVGGVIDSSYRGEVLVKLFNANLEGYGMGLDVEVGDAIAQIVIIRISEDESMIETDLNETIRGESGFGSTGR